MVIVLPQDLDMFITHRPFKRPRLNAKGCKRPRLRYSPLCKKAMKRQAMTWKAT
jgi:hypothetical protein